MVSRDTRTAPVTVTPAAVTITIPLPRSWGGVAVAAVELVTGPAARHLAVTVLGAATGLGPVGSLGDPVGARAVGETVRVHHWWPLDHRPGRSTLEVHAESCGVRWSQTRRPTTGLRADLSADQ